MAMAPLSLIVMLPSLEKVGTHLFSYGQQTRNTISCINMCPKILKILHPKNQTTQFTKRKFMVSGQQNLLNPDHSQTIFHRRN